MFATKKRILLAALGMTALALCGFLISISSNEPIVSIRSQMVPDVGQSPTPSAAHVKENRPLRAAPTTDSEQHVGQRESDVASPQCTANSDCQGPRLAECIKVMCDDGRCTYDKSDCECISAADCEDNDPCTRNHCFARTLKCIFIPKGCD